MITTDEMSLVTYDYGHRYILPHATRCFHRALAFHKTLFDYTPTEKISVLIQDFGDYGNAGATAVPRNAISMGLSPFSYAFETSPAGERVFSMMNHELVHVVALDNATKTDRFYQGMFFGKVDPSPEHPESMIYSYLTSPRRYSPRWYHEGIASYVETWMSGGVGLAMGSYDEMVFRTRVLENARIYSAQGLESAGVTSDFQGRSNSYLYGTRFMGYLAYTYGPQKAVNWVKRDAGSKRSFARQFKNVFDKPITAAWNDWIEFEKTWQQDNLQRLRKNTVTAFTPVTDAVGSVSYAFHDVTRNRIYVAVNNPGQVPHLASLNLATGKLSKLTDIKGAALFYVSSVAYDAAGDILYYTTDNDSWRDLNSYNIKTRKTTRLQKDVRTGDLAFNAADQSIWGIKHLNGYSTITRIPKAGDPESGGHPYSTWEQVYTLGYGQDIFDIDISPDGKLLSAAVSDLDGSQSLLLFNIDELLQQQYLPDLIFDFDISSPQSFRFTRDGKYLYGTSYYSGVSNIFRVEVATKTIDAMSNSITGLFRPVVLDTNRLFAFNFVSNGFQPVILSNAVVEDVSSIDYLGNITIEKYPELIDWELAIAGANDPDIIALDTTHGVYRPGKEMHLNYGYPIVVGYKNNVGLGYHFNVSDPFNFRTLNVTLAFTPRTWTNSLIPDRDSSFIVLDDEELIHASLTFETGPLTFEAGYNEANFYDLFGPSQSSRKGLRAGVHYDKSLLYDPPRVLDFRAGVTGFYGLDQSPEFQQILVSGYNNNFFLNFSSSLSYRAVNSSLGAVDGEKGLSATLWGSMAMSAGNFFPRVIGLLDYGIQLPGKHFSLWLRTAGGSSFNDIFNPFTRFGFAAFGNNYVDNQTTRQYRGPFAFPGLRYDADRSIIAQRFAKGTAELVIPPIRFRKLGGFNFYANWIQPTVFSSVLYTRNANNDPTEFVNLGGQLDLRLVTFSLLPATISVGYAQAWDLNTDDNFDEWMVSLRILH
jgi:hypothetical protein